MRISYIHGPGDVFRTFRSWLENRNDGSIIKQTYSGQFFDLVTEIDATGQIICLAPAGRSDDTRFTFDSVSRSHRSGLNYYIDQFEYAKTVSDKIYKFRPDVIIFSSDFPIEFLDVLPSEPKKIISIHNTFWRPYGIPNGIKEKLLFHARKISLRNINVAVCVSLECQRQLKKMRAGSAVFSTVQIPRLPVNFQKTAVSSPKNFLYVGRVELNKGIQDLIHAFQILKRDFGDVKLKVVGNGGGLAGAKELATHLGVADYINFMGRLDAYGVGRSYAEADWCVCPTRWDFNEGLATVPLEAASYGVPTIMSHAVPAKEQFGSGAILFEPGNIHDLYQKMRYAITDNQAIVTARQDARESFVRTMQDVPDWKSGIFSCLERLNLGQ